MYQPKEDMADGLGLTSSDDKPRDRERRLYSNLGVDPEVSNGDCDPRNGEHHQDEEG
jgi:hypothetical protein